MSKNRMSKKNRRNAGFTMAELLIVIAILGALAAVAIVGVVNYMRTMTKLEYDGYAKEIFIAAQNHLTLADSQGLVANADHGVADEPKQAMSLFAAQENNTAKTAAESENGIYYFVVDDSNGRTALSSYSSALGLMLPFASVDETIRLGGCYLIQYNENTGRVLKVFYWDEKGRYPYKYGDSDDYAELIKVSDSADYKSQFKSYSFESNSNSVIGYYNGEDGIGLGSLEKPKLKVINAERLEVEITDGNTYSSTNPTRRLIITGLTSGAKTYIDLGDGDKKPEDHTKFLLTLDDITESGKSFNAQFGEGGSKLKGEQGKTIVPFIPGENLQVQVMVMDNSAVAYSVVSQPFNSLFASIDGTNDTTAKTISAVTARIGNIRHLENLSKDVSALDTSKVEVKIAEQISDFSWKTFSTVTQEVDSASIIGADKTTTGYPTIATNSFYPVTTEYVLEYDGKTHSISDVVITEKGSNVFDGNAGLFDKLEGGDIVKHLKLVDFTVTGNDNAGALAGTINGEALDPSKSVVENVVVVSTATAANTPNITGVNNAGGLAGLVQKSTITKSAAAVKVASTSGNAGGLIGEISDTGTRATSITEIAACYSGGHTVNGSYTENKDNGNTAFDVTGNIAGGLVGAANGAKINYSYSTCSVQGTTNAGGFVGTASGTISNCYATGLVEGTATTTLRGTFAGQTALNGATNCQYFEIINEEKTDAGYTYLTPLAKTIGNDGKPDENSGTSNAITALDASAASYNSFSGNPSENWKAAVPYDGALMQYYQGKYNLQTVAELGATVEDTDFVAVHYGDWPAPEVFVIND